MSTQNQNFISNFANAINDVLQARAALKQLREQDVAAGIVAGLQASDFTGSNAYLAPADVVAAEAAMDAIEAILTDFTKTPPQPTTALKALLKFRP
jgi:hypothetical protein